MRSVLIYLLITVVFSFVFPLSSASAAVVINEFLPNPLGSGDTDEWVEFYNPDSLTVDLFF